MRLPILVVVAATLSCGGGSLPAPTVTAAPVAIEEPDEDVLLPTAFQVTERAGVARPDGLLEAGLPLARGAVRSPEELSVLGPDGALPTEMRALAHWPDGSLRWVLVRAPLELAAGEQRELRLVAEPGPRFDVKAPELPDLTLVVETDKGTERIPVEPRAFGARGALGFGAEFEPLTNARVRVRVQLAQLDGDASWRAVRLEVAGQGARVTEGLGAGSAGGWSAAVLDAAGREQTHARATAKALSLSLFRAEGRPYPADEGFHVSHVVVLERGGDAAGLAARIDRPLRASLSPAYVDATRAMGRIAPAGEATAALDRSFEQSWASLREQRREPRNRGWTVWGDFDVRGRGLAYAGYLNQEYDPGATLFLHSMRTGNVEALDDALEMARQFADNGVSLEGGCYQHRATLHALERWITESAGAALRQRWSVGSDEGRLVQAVESAYDKKTSRKVEAWFDAAPPGTAAERVDHVSDRFAHALIVATREEAENDRSALAKRLARPDATMRDYAAYLVSAQFLGPLELPDVDALFGPFFARYGGSWDDFPPFHFCEMPDVTVSHSAGHTLVEMLVYGHFATGDPSLRRAALSVAEFLIEGGILADGLEEVRSQAENGQRVHARMVGWSLVNLLAVQPLTEELDPALDARVDAAVEELVETIAALPADRYDSILHAGIVCEGLIRHWEETGSDTAKRAAIDVAWYWASTQWLNKHDTFNYRNYSGSPASPGLVGLLLEGLVFAAWQTQDATLADRARDALRVVTAGPEDYVKEFAQKFRSSPRALAYWTGLP